MQVTKLIALDATQMGTQTCAALLGDRETAKLVNMVPCEAKADVYSQVATVMKETLATTNLTKVPAISDLYINHGNKLFNRNVWKRPTMTILYGATYMTYTNHLQEDIEKATGIKLSNPDAQFLGKMTEKVLVKVLPAAVLLMRSLTGIVSTVVSSTNKPFIFTTATGSEFEAVKYKTKLSRDLGRQAGFNIGIKVDTKNINVKATAKSAAAQYIQSFDAVIAGSIQTQMAEKGIPLLSVFDSWAVPMGYTEALVDVSRSAYIEHLSNKPLQKFYNEAKNRYPILWKHPELFLEMGDYRVEDELPKCKHFIGL